VSDSALPFVGFIELSQIPETTRSELLGKMLSGELLTYVYSSEANGKLDPVQITPAEFFKAWGRAQREAENDCVDANWWPLKRMEPFQIRVPDQDSRRSLAVRRRMGVPHWIYLLKADLAPRKGKGGRKPIVDWKVVFVELERLMDHYDEFGADVPEWNAQARLIEALQKFCSDKFGIEPDKNTIEGRIKGPLAQWREQRTRRPET
jgi:hypothetical protein